MYKNNSDSIIEFFFPANLFSKQFFNHISRLNLFSCIQTGSEIDEKKWRKKNSYTQTHVLNHHENI